MILQVVQQDAGVNAEKSCVKHVIGPRSIEVLWLTCGLLNEVTLRIGVLCVISGFSYEVDKNCALLGYYAARSSYFLLTFQDNQSLPFSRKLLTLEDVTEWLPRNVGKELTLLAA